MQADVGKTGADFGPLGLRFLDAVFAEVAMAGGNQPLDVRGAAAFGSGNQGDVAGLAARKSASRGYAVADNGQPGSGISRQNLKAVPR